MRFGSLNELVDRLLGRNRFIHDSKANNTFGDVAFASGAGRKRHLVNRSTMGAKEFSSCTARTRPRCLRHLGASYLPKEYAPQRRQVSLRVKPCRKKIRRRWGRALDEGCL